MYVFMYRTQYPQKITSVLEADFHQKLLMKFSLKDKSSGDTFTAHQTFVKLTNTGTKQEIIFVAEMDSSNNYKFDLVRFHVLYKKCLWLFTKAFLVYLIRMVAFYPWQRTTFVASYNKVLKNAEFR